MTTGVAIYGGNISVSFAETTSVKFFELSEDQIDAYVATGDSLDKAGGMEFKRWVDCSLKVSRRL